MTICDDSESNSKVRSVQRDLKLDIQPGRNGSTMVTATIGNDIVAVETLDLAKSRARDRLTKAICECRPEIDRAEVDSKLLALAAKEVDKHEDSSPGPGAQPEIDISRLVRPELLITPEVSALAIPKMVVLNGEVNGNWQWYLRWKDGTRELRPVQNCLTLPGGDRLWVHPRPGAPSPAVKPGWSAGARKRWLSGESVPNVAALFRALCRLLAYYLELPKPEAPGIIATLAAWIILTYVYPAWSAVPYLYLGGPAGSGKSTVFDLLARLAYRPLVSSSMTAASLFRTLHSQGGVLLLDEAERLKDARSPDIAELLAMLLAGYRRGGSATRLEPLGDSDFRTVSFDVYGPKALACIAGLPAALDSRAISITMFRAAPGSRKPLRRLDASGQRFQVLRNTLHSVALEHGPQWLELACSADVCPKMTGRDFQLWQPILSICSLIDDCGAQGLLTRMQDHAMATIESASEDRTPDCDEVLLQCLATEIQNGERPACGQILEAAKTVDPEGFKRWTAKGVSQHLKRYGLRTNKTGGKRCYGKVTLQDLALVERNYGVDLGTTGVLLPHEN